MDRNTITGFALLALLLIAYITYNNYSQSEFQKKQTADSVANAKLHPRSIAKDTTRTSAAVAPVSPGDALTDSQRAALPPALRGGVGQVVTLENKNVAIQFSTRGATPVAARLKDYKTYGKAPLHFFKDGDNKLAFVVPNGGTPANTSELAFTATQQGPQSLDFMADLGGGRSVDLIYTLPAEGYMVQCAVKLTGMQASALPLQWNVAALHTERDIATERQNTQLHFKYKGGDHDYFTVTSDGLRKSPGDAPLHWMGLRTQYFTTALISEEGFARPDLSTVYKDTGILATNTAKAELPIKGDGTGKMRWYVGPNHYRTLKNYDIGLDKMVPMGVGVFAFTRYINKWLIVPVFDVFTKFISNYGVIIMLLTVFIKLLTSFFTYKSYLSSAKMRVLKPELDELRAKIGDDQQKMGMEQMKMYRSAGVNPMGGCLPTLFMLPFLMAMYSFIPSAVEFRQKPFLWADDLSTYDSIASLPFSFFDHISLFTLLMTASSLFLALYNRNMTPQDPNNPMLKYMPYIFPFVLLGVFNKMAAALTFYYFFSNMVTILQQYVIQNFIINEDKIHKQIKEARLKPATPSKWQAKMEELQKANADRTKGTPAKKRP